MLPVLLQVPVPVLLAGEVLLLVLLAGELLVPVLVSRLRFPDRAPVLPTGRQQVSAPRT